MKDIKNKSIDELSKRLVEIKKEEHEIMLELWKRCPSPKEEMRESYARTKKL